MRRQVVAVSRVLRVGLCVIHAGYPENELQTLLMRHSGAVPPLRSIAAGMEYERADGSRHGYTHDGEHYEVIGGREVIGFHQ